MQVIHGKCEKKKKKTSRWLNIVKLEHDGYSACKPGKIQFELTKTILF